MGLFSSSRRSRDPAAVRHQLESLSHAFQIYVGDDDEFVIVEGVRLPPGFNRFETQLLIELPADYPLSPPGIGASQVYVSPALRFLGRKLQDIHEYSTPSFETPGFGPWAWWCYEDIRWDPFRDNLVDFVEMIRADMTDPSTQ